MPPGGQAYAVTSGHASSPCRWSCRPPSVRPPSVSVSIWVGLHLGRPPLGPPRFLDAVCFFVLVSRCPIERVSSVSLEALRSIGNADRGTDRRRCDDPGS